MPPSTIDLLERYGELVLSYNSLRASKGLLSEACRLVEGERDQLVDVWGDFRIEYDKINND